MGKYEKGKSGNPATQINGEIAVEYQRRSAESRKANTTVREALLRELEKKAGADGELTRLEALVLKAVANHAKGKLSFKDLKDLQDILGESVQNVNVKTDPAVIPMTEAALEALGKWASKETE